MAQAALKRSIFRSKTLQTYIQNREKSVLPRLVAPPVFVLCWVILILFILAGVIVWNGEVPVYIAGSGVIVEPSALSQPGDEATAIILFPLSDVSRLHTGLPIQIQLGQTNLVFNCRITAVSQTPLSPDRIQQQYRLEVPGPAVVVTVGLGHAIPASLYAGSHVQAQFRVGSQSLLALFPVINSL
jgi:hypothetical protein